MQPCLILNSGELSEAGSQRAPSLVRDPASAALGELRIRRYNFLTDITFFLRGAYQQKVGFIYVNVFIFNILFFAFVLNFADSNQQKFIICLLAGVLKLANVKGRSCDWRKRWKINITKHFLLCGSLWFFSLEIDNTSSSSVRFSIWNRFGSALRIGSVRFWF